MKKRSLAVTIAIAMVISLLFSASVMAAESDEVPAVEGEINNMDSFEKYGHAKTNISKEDFFAAGYQYGDIVTINVNGQDIDMPFCSNYPDVDSGKVVLLAKENEDVVKLCINNQKFLETYGIATYSKDANENVVWTLCEGVTLPLKVTIKMKEAGGYLAQYEARNISYSLSRDAYPQLTDEQFANFRNITTTGMAAGVLYRSSSPINPETGRNTYADAAFKNAGITVVMNLADSEETAKSYEGFDKTYYSGTKYIALNMSHDVLSDEFKEQLVKGLRFFAENPGIYAVHCTEGKDRAGFVSALLECFMGATAKEVVSDYMVTYYNYYGITEDSATYSIFADDFINSLQQAFGVEDIYSANLTECANTYFKSIGLTDAEIAALRTNLGVKDSKKVVPQTGTNNDPYIWLFMSLAACIAAAGVMLEKKKN